MVDILNTIFIIIFILFLPGLVVSFTFFDANKIDLVDRIAVSFGLSIAIIPLVVFYMNLLGIPITKLNVIYQVILVIAVGGIGTIVRKLFKK